MKSALDNFLLIHNVLDIIRSGEWEMMTAQRLRRQLEMIGINADVRTVQRHLTSLQKENIIKQVGKCRISQAHIFGINPHHSVNKNPDCGNSQGLDLVNCQTKEINL